MTEFQGCLAKKGEKMNFKYPLLLVAEREFLESFQSGNLYMVNCLHYQQIEKEDPQRGDKYDGAVKCTSSNYYDEQLLKNVENPRLMILSTYIKCFYHFKDNDMQKINDNEYHFTISKESADELKSFHKEYALIIYDVPKFIERFNDACKRKKIISNYFYSDITYIDDEEYPKYEKELIRKILGEKTEGVTKPTFLKRKKYSAQQEFRISVSLHMEEPPDNAIGIRPPRTISFSMKGIEDISTIVNLQGIIDKPYILRSSKE